MTITLDNNGNTLNANVYSNNTITSIQNDINTNLTEYSSLYSNYTFLLDLYEKYIEEKSQNYQKTSKNKSNILVNERKTFYKDQSINLLNNYYYWFIVIYIITVIIFIIFLILFPPVWSIFKKIGITIGLIVLPFTSFYILSFIIEIFRQIYLLLKNTN